MSAGKHCWKWISEPGENAKLFDLKHDACESTNVADEHPEVMARLQEAAERAREDLGDRLTKRKGSGIRAAGKLGPNDRRLGDSVE